MTAVFYTSCHVSCFSETHSLPKVNYTTAVKLSLVLHKILPPAVVCSVTVSPFLLGLTVLLQLFFFHFYHIVE